MTQRYLDSAKMALVAAPEEHFIAIGLSESGGMTFEHQEHGSWNHCAVDIKAICQQASKGTSRVLCFHNHVTGDTRMSPEDRDTTERLTTALKAWDVECTHEIIPGDVDLQESTHHRTESQPPMTTWEAAELKESRLWRAYGGRNPYAR